MAAFGSPATAEAGQLKVAPIRVDLTAEQPIAQLRIGNTGDQSTLIHIQLRDWQHPDGHDSYAETRDLLLNPMIFELGPNEEQLVRIGLARPMAGPLEGAYRLFVREVPRGAGGARQKIRTYLNIGLPVFVAPKEAIPASLEWRVLRDSDGGLALRVENRGALHGKLTDIRLVGADGRMLLAPERHVYVLPGQLRAWRIESEGLEDGEQLHLTAMNGSEPLATTLRLTDARVLEKASR